MLKTILAGVLSLFVSCNVSAQQSVKPLSHVTGGNYCTAFSIDKQRGYWMTAAHCLDGEDKLVVDGKPAELVDGWKGYDIAVLKGETGVPSLRLAKKAPELGDPVYVTGYGLGGTTLTLTRGFLANVGVPGPEGALYQVYDMILYPGHSGAPIMDQDNKVIGIAQIRPAGVGGAGIRWIDLRTLTLGYWE